MSKAFPDGIEQAHLEGKGRFTLRFPWFPMVVLGAILATAFTGVLGGGNAPVLREESAAGALTVEAPARLRNGEFFEMHFTGEARRAMAKPTIAVEGGYWQDLTINTMIPAPASESYENGYFLFEYDPIDAGDKIGFKIDGQVNPTMFGGTRGVVSWRDGDTVIAEVPVRLRVLP